MKKRKPHEHQPRHIDLRRSLPNLRASLTPRQPATFTQEPTFKHEAPRPGSFLPLLLAAVLVWSAAVGLIIYFTNP